jgi:VWFA-related protein
LSPGFLALTQEEQRGAMNLIQRALDAGVVISGLDVRGLAAVNLASNRSHVNEPAEQQVLSGQEGFASGGLLADFAYGTGGTYFHDNDDLDEAFRRAAEVPEYVYILGFSPQRLDGKFHKLKIMVGGPSKRNIQARSGYYAVKPSPAQ